MVFEWGVQSDAPCHKAQYTRTNTVACSADFTTSSNFRSFALGSFNFAATSGTDSRRLNPPELPGCTGTLIRKHRALSCAPDSAAISPLATGKRNWLRKINPDEHGLAESDGMRRKR